VNKKWEQPPLTLTGVGPSYLFDIQGISSQKYTFLGLKSPFSGVKMGI
jgi:hypothetical protein